MTTDKPKPLPPEDDDCCGGGACTPCVWDNYFIELEKWNAEQAKLKNTDKEETHD